MRAPIQSILFLSFFAFACSSDPVTPAADAGPDGSKPKDSGSDATPPPDISGTTALSLTVVSNSWSGPQTDGDTGTPVSGAAVRVENGAGGFLEGVTDSTGKATLKVDTTKGPFDVTVAKAAMGATSILGVTSAADLTKVIWMPQPLPRTEYTIAGAINGKKAAANLVQIDAPWFQTVFAKTLATTYSTKHVYVPDDPSPVTVAAIEIDATNAPINAVMMPGVARTQGTMTADITFPAVAVTPTVTNVTITLPTTGALTASDITKVGQTGLPAYTNAIVQQTAGKSATYVGLGLISKPSGNTANFKITSFGGDLAPTSAYAILSNGADLSFSVGTVDFSASPAGITVPPVAKLAAAGTSLGDATLEFDSTGYDYFAGSVYDATAQDTVWDVYATGKSLAAHPFPHLPSTVPLTAITSATDVIIGIAVVKSAKTPKDYGGVPGTQAFVNASSDVQVSAAF